MTPLDNALEKHASTFTGQPEQFEMSFRKINYSHGDVALIGKLKEPVGKARAAVMIVPTIAGPNQIMFDRAEWLASLGYSAFVCDIYGGGEDLSGAADLMQRADDLRADPAYYRERFRCALNVMQRETELPAQRLAAIGFCMGGQAVLELARDGAEFALGISFHGLLDTKAPAAKDAIQPRLLICHGQDDPMVPPDQVRTFQDEMDAAGANWHMHIYSGTRHGFTDPASDERDLNAVAYNASAHRQSMTAMISLFDELFAD